MKNNESNTEDITIEITKAVFGIMLDETLNLINCAMEAGKFLENWKFSTMILIENEWENYVC